MKQPDVIDGFRLSPQQKRLWSLLGSHKGAEYLVQCSVLIDGEIDSLALKASFDDVIAEHEILRTTFRSLPELHLPVQVIKEAASAWEEMNLLDLTETDRQAFVNTMWNDWKQSRFGLDQGPMIRSALIRLTVSQTILFIAISALCSDLAGLKNVAEQIVSQYNFRIKGRAWQSPPLQYADISEYLNQLIDDDSKGAGYWSTSSRTAWSGGLLPFEREHKHPANFQINSASRSLNSEVVALLRDTADQYHTTPDVVLLTCWYILICRMIPERDVVVAVAFDGRRFPELVKLPGTFVKYLPLEWRPQIHALFSEALKEISSRVSTHSEWQDLFTWERGAGASLNPDSSYIPIAFEYNDFTTHDKIGDALLSIVQHYALVEPFDFRLSCGQQHNGLAVQIDFDAALFERADVETVLEQFVALVKSSISQPELAFETLLMLDAAGSQRILVEFNRTEQDYSGIAYVQNYVEEHARSIPDAIAVTYADQSLSYRQLNSRANQIANYLIAKGVGPEVIVGICMQRSLDTLPAILGVLKAGGAYLPLDPKVPQERLMFMLADCDARLVLAQKHIAQQLNTAPAEMVVINEEADPFGTESASNPEREIDKDNLAYVIYTSGSTGQPKGVMITHEGLRNYLTWCTRFYRTADGWGAPLHSSLAFDLTVTSLFSPLIAGRQVTFLSDEDTTAEALADVLRQFKNSSFVKLTPSHLRLLSLLLRPDELARATKGLIIGGESLYTKDIAVWQAHAPDSRLINEYGPTETVVGCCVFETNSSGAGVDGTVPIGCPIANTSIYVLDDHMVPVPFFVAGEICIGGRGVARGYLNRPELTAEKFVPNAFASRPGERIYRTGDFGRYRSDGTIEFLGRSDGQVKFKGYRIELGEIETCLVSAIGVQDAVVVVREENEQKRLVAYLAVSDGGNVNQDDFRSYVARKLPEYMVPSTFVILAQLPLTPNGKIDRKALPDPACLSETGAKYAAPETAVEKLLADLWAKALGRSYVGVHDNFFELGGDSILSIQIAHRAMAAGVRLTPRQIFRYRTIAELARSLEEVQAHIPEIQTDSGPVPLTPIQAWFFEQNLTNPHHWNQSVMLELRRPVEPALLESALKHVIAHHDALRLRFHFDGVRWQQVCVPTESADVLAQISFAAPSGKELEATIEAFATEFQKTLNLSQGPIIRAALLELAPPARPRLLLAVHHLAIDIVSWTFVFDSLKTACEQIEGRQPISLPATSTAFSIWSRQLAECSRSERFDGELDYWLSADRRWACKIPLDQHSGFNTEESARTVWVSLDEKTTDALLHALPKRYRTMINDVLLAALVQSFSRWTHSRSLLVDLESHGREDLFNDVDISRTVGWFTCIFPVLLDIGDALTARDCLKRVKEQVRSVPNGGIGYGLLRYMKGKPEINQKLGLLPQAEISFNYVGRSGQSLFTTGLLMPCQSSVGRTRGELNLRHYLIEVNGGITNGELRTAWTYSEHLHRRETIEHFACGFNDVLRAMVHDCLSQQVFEDETSELIVPGISPKELDTLITQVGTYED
jgi:amino acid adenylation domain-containing protein/non-ribosomal peptide synthase protein (TIGR01720 family)